MNVLMGWVIFGNGAILTLSVLYSAQSIGLTLRAALLLASVILLFYGIIQELLMVMGETWRFDAALGEKHVYGLSIRDWILSILMILGGYVLYSLGSMEIDEVVRPIDLFVIRMGFIGGAALVFMICTAIVSWIFHWRHLPHKVSDKHARYVLAMRKYSAKEIADTVLELKEKGIVAS